MTRCNRWRASLDLTRHAMSWVLPLLLVSYTSPIESSAETFEARWLEPTDGNWDDAANWSTDAFPQSNQPRQGDDYHVVLDASGEPHVVTIGQGSDPIHVRSLEVGPDAELHLFRSFLSVDEGINLAGGSIKLTDGNSRTPTLTFVGLESDPVISGSGSIIVRSTDRGAVIAERTSSSLTIGPSATVDLVFGELTMVGSELINLGTMQVGAGGRALRISSESFLNQGLLDLAGQTVLGTGLDSRWRNEGVIHIRPNGTLLTLGTYTTADLGEIINESQKGLILGGILRNEGAVLELNNVVLHGIVRGGVIATPLALDPADATTLDDVTLTANGRLDGQLNVLGTLTLDDVDLVMGERANLDYLESPEQHLSGKGTIRILEEADVGATVSLGGPNLAIGEAISVRVEANRSDIQFRENLGTIELVSPTGVLTIRPGSDGKNEGTLRATEGTIRIDGQYSSSGLGNVEIGNGMLELAGRVDNQDNVLRVKSGIQLTGELLGGRLELSSPITAKGRWEDVQLASLDAPVVATIENSATLTNSLDFDNAGIVLNGGATLNLNGERFEFSGNGEILLNGPRASSTIHAQTPWTIGEGIVVRAGHNGGGQIFGNNTRGVNLGLILVDQPGRSIQILGEFANAGTLSAAAGGILVIDSNQLVNRGSIALDDGFFRLTGGQLVNEPSGVIMGSGVLEFLASGELTNRGKLQVMDQLQLAGDLTQSNESVLHIELGDHQGDDSIPLMIDGTLSLAGDLQLNVTPAYRTFLGQQMILARASELLGSFAQSELGLGHYRWTIETTDTEVRLTTIAVPEPHAWLAMAGGAVFLLFLRRRHRMTRFIGGVLAVAVCSPQLQAQIVRWDNGQTVPGGESVMVEPGFQFLTWNRELKNLQFADLTQLDLSNARFANVWGQHMRLDHSNLTSAEFIHVDLTGASLRDVDLRGARFEDVVLTDADFAGAVISDVEFADPNGQTLSADQLRSSASYQTGDLSGLRVPRASWDGINLFAANLQLSAFRQASFAGAELGNTNLRFTDFHSADFTGSSLVGAKLNHSILTNTAFWQADLQNATLVGARLERVDFEDANLAGVDISGTSISSSVGNRADFSAAELARTSIVGGSYLDANFQESHLHRATIVDVDLTNANFAEADLSEANIQAWMPAASFRGTNLSGAKLAGNIMFADFTDATISGADFSGTLIHRRQIESTTSFRSGELAEMVFHNQKWPGINFSAADLHATEFRSTQLVDADFRHANLNGSRFRNVDLSQASFRSADLSGAWLSNTTSNDVDFADAIIAGIRLHGEVLTESQFVQTSSYQQRRLADIEFQTIDIRGWDLQQQDLTGASFTDMALTDVNFSGATLNDVVFSADIDNATFRGASLVGAVFVQSSFGRADFTDANVERASFEGATQRGFEFSHLASTASYENGSLRGMHLGSNDMTGWNFAGQDLSGANLANSILTDADFTGARITGASLAETVARGLTPEQIYATAQLS